MHTSRSSCADIPLRRNWLPLVAASIACSCTHAPLHAAAPAAGSTHWPPQHMRNLPPDYLERVHASLVAGKARMDRLKLSDTTSAQSIGWARYGLASLILGERVEEINRFFESDKFE